MPAVSMKQFKVITPAGSNTTQTSVQASPALPGRTLLAIQNVGTAVGLLHFKENVQGDASDLSIAIGEKIIFDQADTCPREKINLGSVTATAWAILEQVTNG